jgi:hypothetical protein
VYEGVVLYEFQKNWIVCQRRLAYNPVFNLAYEVIILVPVFVVRQKILKLNRDEYIVKRLRISVIFIEAENNRRCERSEAIQFLKGSEAGLRRRYAPRNDEKTENLSPRVYSCFL